MIKFIYLSGLQNIYLIQTSHDLALKYNDKSVLENYHVSSFFKIIDDNPSDFNIFDKYLKEDYNKTREVLISMVLATDMSFHF